MAYIDEINSDADALSVEQLVALSLGDHDADEFAHETPSWRNGGRHISARIGNGDFTADTNVFYRAE